MKKSLTFTIFALLTSLAPLSAGAQARLTLVDSIAVEAPSVRLADVASIETEDEALRQRLAQLIVGEAPNLSGSRLISAYRIRATLEKAQICEVEIQGTQTTVTTAVRELSGDDVQALVDEWIDTQLKEEQDVEADYLALPKSWKVPAGKAVELAVKFNGKQLVGPVTLTLQAKAGERVFATTRVRMSVDMYQEAIVLVRPLKRGEALQEEHIERRRAKVNRSSGMEVVNPDTVMGMVAKKDFPIGYRPTVNDFARPIEIKRGSSNRIIVMNDGLRLSVSGATALQDGRKGDSIMFSNPMNTGEPLRAEVVRPGLAIIKMN